MLWTHQEEAITAFVNGKRLIAYDMGTGKTRIALEIIKRMDFQRALVICPLSSFSAWMNENKLYNYSINIYNETRSENNSRITIISYDIFRIDNINYNSYDFVIFDEIHKLKNPSAKRTKKAIKTFSNHAFKIGLSGTPIIKMWEIYSQVKTLFHDFWQKELNVKSYTQFIKTFFYCHPIVGYPIKPYSWAQPMLDRALNKVCIAKKRDETQLPELHKVSIEIPMKVKKLSDFIDIGDFQIARIQASGWDENRILVNDAKLRTLNDILEQTDNRVIVFCQYLHEVEEISKKYKTYKITGSDKRELANAINNGNKIICATYCISEGVNLQKHYNTIIFFSLPMSYRDYEQSISRVYRYGQREKVIVYHLLGGWIDKRIYELLSNGEDVLNHFMKITGGKI